MKAVLLAAGLGARLRPLTDRVPKCLVPVGGRPLLEIWLEHLIRHGVREVLINTHHLAPLVQEFVGSWHGDLAIHLAHEATLAGSAGTLRRNWGFLQSERRFLVCNADNLTDIDISSLAAFHDDRAATLTMALFETARPSECGIVETDRQGRVRSFIEKPQTPRSNLANGGVYVMDAAVGTLLPQHEPADIAFDLIPQCLDKTYGWKWDGLLVDIGTPAAYQGAQRLLKYGT